MSSDAEAPVSTAERSDEASRVDPPLLFEDYVSTRKRAPSTPPVIVPETISETSGPAFGHRPVAPGDSDLTRQLVGEPLGERIIVTGRVLDSEGRPIRDNLVEIWQANSAGRYAHDADQHPAPLDPNFAGGGRCLTDSDGRYQFTTIKPGAYPWGNHPNAWRPAHIHFSLFGSSFSTRLITQMYFPGDPLFEYDPIFQSVRDPAARGRMISALDMQVTKESWALGYRFDIVLGGRYETPMENKQ